MKYTVYILKSDVAKKYYTGCTSDIDNRLRQHNAGECRFTKRYMPWKIYYSETFNNKIDAFKREKYLKSHAGRKWLKNNQGD